MKEHNNAPALDYHGKPTFAGILMLYWHEMSTGWNDTTDQQYRHLYYDYIIPLLPNHDARSIDMLDRKDFDHCIQAIQRKGYLSHNNRKDYAEMTVEKLWYLIQTAVEIAARHYLCRDIFKQEKPKAARHIRKDEKSILRRSLTATQQVLAERILLTDPLQSGANMGLALMLALGVRDAEACGLNFGDIRPMKGHPEVFFAWIYKSTQIGSNRQQASGKTPNADRLIPVPKCLLTIIEARRRHLVSLGLEPSSMPIACRRNNYSIRCSADDLTEAAHPFFAELGILYEQINCINDLIQEAHCTSVYGPEVCEKTPTAYLLRRNFATRLSYRNLTVSEICYVMGHDIEDPAESRNEFMADEKLLRIWAKMVVSPIAGYDTLELSVQSVQNLDGTSYHLQMPHFCHKLCLNLMAREPGESIHLKISGTGQHSFSQELLCFQQKITYSNTVNLSEDFRSITSTHRCL